MEPRWHDSLGQTRRTPTLLFGEPEEGAKTLRVIADRDPAVIAGVIARDRLADVGDPDRGQSNTSFVRPVEETIDRMAATTDRLFGPSAFVAHPRREERDLAGMGVLGCLNATLEAIAHGHPASKLDQLLPWAFNSASR